MFILQIYTSIYVHEFFYMDTKGDIQLQAVK